MKSFVSINSKTAAVAALLLALILNGCAAQTGTTNKKFEDNFRFVPRIHVEDNSFGTTNMNYHHCQYDWYYDGYWCLAE